MAVGILEAVASSIRRNTNVGILNGGKGDLPIMALSTEVVVKGDLPKSALLFPSLWEDLYIFKF